MKSFIHNLLSLDEFFYEPPFVFFLTISVTIHLVLLLTIPIKSRIHPRVRSEIFEVDLVPPLPLHPQKISTKSVKTLKPLRQASKSDVEQKNTKNKKTEDPFTLKEKEATVTLYTDDKKHAKYSSYLAHLRYKIDSLWEYPSLAKEKRIEGELTLRFTIRKNGSLIEVKLLESSGQQVLDQEAFRTIHDAAPFKPFPDNFLISRLNVLATFKYQFSAE